MKSLTDKQLEIIPLLSQGRSYQQITDITGIPKPTVGRWAKLPKIQEEVSRFQENRIEICRQSATTDLEGFKNKLREAKKRQEQYIKTAQQLGFDCSKLAETLMQKALKILEEDGNLTPRLLATLIPNLIKTANDSFRVGSEIEDKMFALQEMNKRLDEWEERWQESQQ